MLSCSFPINFRLFSRNFLLRLTAVRIVYVAIYGGNKIKASYKNVKDALLFCRMSRTMVCSTHLFASWHLTRTLGLKTIWCHILPQYLKLNAIKTEIKETV